MMAESFRWTFEVFRTVIGTLQSLAWLLLVFFVFALIADVVVGGLELRRLSEPHAGRGQSGPEQAGVS
jgi:hypothetical protein